MANDPAERDAALLLDMLLAARDGVKFVSGLTEAEFLASRLHQNALVRAPEIIGEAADRVSRNFCNEHAEIAWREITGMRHLLIHGYAEVRLDLVWTVAQERLPPLIAALEPLVPPDPGAA